MVPNIAVILTDSSRRILWVNDDFTQITGYSLGEVFGKKPSILQGPKTEQSAINRIREGLSNKVSLKEQITNYRKDGELYICKLVIHPIFNQAGQLTNFIAFEVDGNKVQHEQEIPLFQLDKGQKYSSSSLRGVEEYKLFYRLQSLIKTEKLYLDPGLALKSLADKLGTNTKYLSQVINHHSKNNFQRFINTYRVEAVKERIRKKHYQNLTLFGIALQCGFKNKSTFYKVFKEMEGQTPREFVKQLESKSEIGNRKSE